MTSTANHAKIRISSPIATGAPSENIIRVPHHLLHRRHQTRSRQRHNLGPILTMMTALTTPMHAPLVYEDLCPLAVVASTDPVPCSGVYPVALRTPPQSRTTMLWAGRGHSNSSAVHPAMTHFSSAHMRIQTRTSLPPTTSSVRVPQM